MKFANALCLYRVRLRSRLTQECFAVLGIVAGVALLFASQVSSSSLRGSVAQLSRGIVGNATLQLAARDPHGFPESMLAKVRHIHGVSVAAPVFEASANATGPRGSESVELVGANSSLVRLRGRLLAHARAVAIAATGAVAVFGSVAIQGAHGDLLAGLEGAARDTNAFTDLWISPAGSYNLLNTTPFTPTGQARLARLPGVLAVRPYRSGLLDYGYRRVLVVAPARDATPLYPRTRFCKATRPRHPRGCGPAAGLSSREPSPKNSTCILAKRSLPRHPTRRACASLRSPPTSAGRRDRF